MPHTTSIGADYFERMFRDTEDPWEFETSAYEQEKYAQTIAALDSRQYRQGFEVGCANGVLTAMLAPRTERLLAIDVSQTALTKARKRCADMSTIAFDRILFPHQTPESGGFDLIVLSEVAYYWDDADLQRAGTWIAANVLPSADILLVHWTEKTDYPQTGDEAVSKLHGHLQDRIEVLRAERHPQYRLDLWQVRS